jgi:hypothetical protein
MIRWTWVVTHTLEWIVAMVAAVTTYAFAVTFGRALLDIPCWLTHPLTTTGPRLPGGLAAAAPLVVIVMASGYLVAVSLLRRTDLAGSRRATGALTVFLAIGSLGIAGMLAQLAGAFERSGVYAVAGVELVVSCACFVLARRPAARALKSDQPGRSRLSLQGRIALGAAVAAAGAAMFHGLVSPVTEWDALIYHAEVAKLWFMQRPAAPLISGPSVGVLISANYPPLFPAAGAALYAAAGVFDDSYIRVLSPLLFGSVLATVHIYTERLYGSVAASLATLLTAASPLMFAYGGETTNYMLLTCALLWAAILAQQAAAKTALRLWAGAGIVAGLALLTHFYGLFALAFGACAWLIYSRRRSGLARVALMGSVALVIASPWLIRNLVLLHDPLYPLGSPPFPGIGLTQPLWDGSKAEIRHAALSYFGGASGLKLTALEVLLAFFDPRLILVGESIGLFACWYRWRHGDLVAGYLGLAVVAVIVPQLLLGWYWIRALLPVVPIAAVFSAKALLDLRAGIMTETRPGPSRKGRGRSVLFPIATTGALVLTIGLSAQSVARDTTNGSGNQGVWSAYRGDYLAWDWISRNLQPGRKVATLEIRVYYLARPDSVFYLDGPQAPPLLHLSTTTSVGTYLRDYSVDYVLVPGWASGEVGYHPVAGEMPLTGMLGTTDFPLVASFTPPDHSAPTLLFRVGRIAPSRILATVDPGPGWPVPDSANGDFTLGPGTGGDIAIPVSGSAPTTLQFQWKGLRPSIDLIASGPSRIGGVNELLTKPRLAKFTSTPTPDGWSQATLTLPPSKGLFVDLHVMVKGHGATLRDLTFTSAGPVLVRP